MAWRRWSYRRTKLLSNECSPIPEGQGQKMRHIPNNSNDHIIIPPSSLSWMPLGSLPENQDLHRSMLILTSQYGVTLRACLNFGWLLVLPFWSSPCCPHVVLGLVKLVVISYGSQCSVMTWHPSFVASLGLYGFIDEPKFRSSSLKTKGI